MNADIVVERQLYTCSADVFPDVSAVAIAPSNSETVVETRT